MTCLATTAPAKSGLSILVRRQFARLLDWLNEESATAEPLQLSPRDWADLPIHHPAAHLDGGDGRSRS